MKSHPKIVTAFLVTIVLLALYGPARAAEPTEGLISHWAFDEGEGYTAFDATGRNDGTVYGAQWTAGLINDALSFDGNADYVLVGDKDSLDFGVSQDFTITAWFKTSAVSTQMIVNDRVKGMKAGYDFYISGGRIFARIGDTSSAVFAESVDKYVNDNQWHHAAAVFDRTDVITVYVDGEVVATSPTISYVDDVNNYQSFAIGGRLYSITAAYFKGPLDDVRVYGRTLSAEEVQQLYEAAWIPVVALEITGPDPVRENSSAQFTAIVTYEDGSTQDVTNRAIWSAEPNIAAIDDSGLLTTQRIESADQITISAEYTKSSVTVDTQLIVGVTPLVNLEIAGPQQVRENSYAQYQATAYYEDGTDADVTAPATWSVEPPEVAAIGENGQLNTQRIETDTELTVYAAYTVGGATIQTEAAVGVIQPIALEIIGPDKLPGSFQAQYNAQVTYEDDSSADVTSLTAWSVEPEAYATIDENGLISTAEVNQPQDITISAQYTSAAVTVETQMPVPVLPPRILHVPSEYETIQAAIEDALDGDIVLVAPGTYTGEGNRDIHFFGKALTVRSESGPENTSIDCQNEWGFVFEGEGLNSVVDGFTITNGYAGIYCIDSSPLIKNCNITRNLGEEGEEGCGDCGIYCRNSSPTITDCTITDNRADRYGGGIYCDESTPTITNCTISGNYAPDGGGIYCRYSSAAIDNCVITGNSFGRRGGGVYSHRSNLTIANSTIISENVPRVPYRGAGGGGIYAADSTVTITNTTISRNLADETGGGILYYSRDDDVSLTITNSVIAGNSTRFPGGGIFCRGRVSITHTTIANNATNDTGGGIYAFDYAAFDIINSILWGNSPDQIYYGDDTPMVIYSDVQGGWEGEGNIDADPCFVEPGESALCGVEGDYHLLPSSPCIDAAKDAGFYTDIEGTVRPYDYPDIDNNGNLPDFDMGAYEAFILPSYDRAVDRLTSVLDRQAELLALIDEFLSLQWEAYDALEELLDTADYADASKADIISARQKIYSAIQHHEQSAGAFEKGIEKLDESLATLSDERAPNQEKNKKLIE